MYEVWFSYDEVRLYVTTSQIRGEGKGNTWIDDYTYIQMNLIEHTYIPLVIETTHSIVLGCSQIIIKSDY